MKRVIIVTMILVGLSGIRYSDSMSQESVSDYPKSLGHFLVFLQTWEESPANPLRVKGWEKMEEDRFPNRSGAGIRMK